MELKGRPLALSSPRESKQMNEVWEHLPPPAMPCHQPCVRSSVMTCGEPPQELPLPAAPSLLSCESFHAVLRALRASVPYAMRTNSLAIMTALLLLRGVKTATAQGEPLTSSLCQAQSRLSDPAWIILSLTSASFFRNESHFDKGLLLEMVFLFWMFTGCFGQTCFCFLMFSVSCSSPEASYLSIGG